MSRVHAKWCLVVAMLLVPLAILGQIPSIAPQAIAVQGAAAHVYKSIGQNDLRLHVFTPDISETLSRRSAIVFLFGGGWSRGLVTQFVPQSRHLAKRGMVAIVADYRVFSRHGTSPLEAIADAKSAVRWVRAHSAQLGVDPNRIAAAGGSAGGHIALSAAVFDTFDEAGEDKTTSSKPNALVLFNPVLDTTHLTPLLTGRFGDRGREASPVHHLGPGLPPTLILHGKSDTTVPYADADRFCAEARLHRNQCQLVGYDGATHGFFNVQNADGKWYRETLLEADRFLTKIGYLRETPPTQIQ